MAHPLVVGTGSQSTPPTGGAGALTLKMLSGARFMLRFLMRTVSWCAVLQGRRYLLISGLGNSVPSKCFSPKTSRLREEGRHATSLHGPVLQRASPDAPPLYRTALHMIPDELRAT